MTQTAINETGILINAEGKACSDGEYTIQEINSIKEFQTLQLVWNDMAVHEKSLYPFLCFEWIETWLEHFLQKNKLLILIILRRGEPVCIAPFIVKHEKCKGIPVRKIELIGNFYSHIRSLIFHDINNNEKEQVFFTLLKYLFKSVDWDVIDLQALPEERFDFALLNQAATKIGIAPQEYSCYGNWYLDKVEFNGDQYLQGRSTNIRNNIKRYKKALEKAGPLEFVVVSYDDEEQIDRFMDYYYAVYWKSWKKTETDPSFHRDLAKFACLKGWLRLGFLFFKGDPLAAQFWLVHGGVAHILKLVYNEEYKKFIPGVILTAEMMKYVIDNDKVSMIDFGIGDDPYKRDWTPNRRERKGVLICNRTPKGKLLFFLVNTFLPFVNRYAYLKRVKAFIREKLLSHGREKRSPEITNEH